MKAALTILIAFCTFCYSRISPVEKIKINPGDTTITIDNGLLKSIFHYKDGELDGKQYNILHNGDTINIKNYRDGLIDGEQKYFYSHNRLGAINYFDSGYKTGVWFNFDTLGNVSRKTWFDGRYNDDNPIWSGQEAYFKNNMPVFTQIWNNGRRNEVIIHNDSLYQKYLQEQLPIGNTLFIENCASCHAIHKAIIGPPLANIDLVRSQEWLLNFIRDGDKLNREGDKLANQSYQKYGNMKHPPFNYLYQSDLEAILEYIHNSSMK